MRRIYIIPLVMVVVIIIAVSLKIGLAAPGRKSELTYETPPPQAIQHLVTHTPESSPSSTSCDFLADPNVSDGFSQKYGEIRNCYLFDTSWVILTEGLKEPDGTRESGVVAVYRCETTDAVCLDGQQDHPMAGWQIYEPPCPGELSLGFGFTPGKFRIMGTCANYFDVTTGTFSN